MATALTDDIAGNLGEAYADGGRCRGRKAAVEELAYEELIPVDIGLPLQSGEVVLDAEDGPVSIKPGAVQTVSEPNVRWPMWPLRWVSPEPPDTNGCGGGAPKATSGHRTAPAAR